jgi:hypothetical protein
MLCTGGCLGHPPVCSHYGTHFEPPRVPTA